MIVVLLCGCGNLTKTPGDPSVAEQSSRSPWIPPNEKAPDVFRARFETTKGTFVVEVHRDWSPHGADRFYNLVKSGFFNGCRFFRVLPGFVAQFGINGDPDVQRRWNVNIPDDPVKESNRRGTLTFAKSGLPNSRSTQLFINLADNPQLDGMGFSPIGKVVAGMSVVENLYGGYGEGAPRGRGPDQTRIQQEGNAYLGRFFPRLDSIKTATIREEKTSGKKEDPSDRKTSETSPP